MVAAATTGLSITELSRRSGVPAPTLRSWENRYGRPVPTRLPSGHRRYSEQDVEFVHRVVQLRAGGLALSRAMERAGADAHGPARSIYAGLRRRSPGLIPQDLSKRTLLALTHAIEDECCARADRPALFALFQRADFYREAEDRWRELARTAHVAVVFADFEPSAAASPTATNAPLTVPIPQDAPLLREWAVVCDAPDQPACVVAWEFPGQDGVPDADRRFEAVWSLDATLVRAAAQICGDLAVGLVPALRSRLSDVPTTDAAAPSADLVRATDLMTRTFGYLDRAPYG